MTWFEWAEALSYLVTIVGLPLAIVVFMYEQRRNRQNEEEEIYQCLWEPWGDFMCEWCQWRDFREALPELLKGEDEDFCARIQKISAV